MIKFLYGTIINDENLNPDDLKIYVRDHPELTPESKNSEFIYSPTPSREEDIGDQGSNFTEEVPIQEYTDTNDDQIPRHLIDVISITII